MEAFFKLIRWGNVAIIGVTQVLIYHAFFKTTLLPTTMGGLGYTLLVLATCFIAAGGYVINDILDVETDTINKSENAVVGHSITVSRAYTIYMVLTITGVLCGFVVANLVGKQMLATLFIGVSFILYLYASQLKGVAVIGNIIISGIVFLAIVLPIIFLFYPLLPAVNDTSVKAGMLFLSGVVVDYGFFAFLITLLREITKDIEDVDGDHVAGYRTLPILIGRKRTSILNAILGMVVLAIVLRYIILNFAENKLLLIYFLVFIVGPLLYFIIRSFQAETRKEYTVLQYVLKGVMLTGVLSLLFFI